MTDVTVSGLPAIAFEIGVMVLGAAPIWIAAKIVGAGKPTLPRAIAAIFFGAVFSAFTVGIGGFVGILLVPLAFLLAFKLILETSMFGATILAVIAAAMYAAMIHLIGSGINVSH